MAPPLFSFSFDPLFPPSHHFAPFSVSGAERHRLFVNKHRLPFGAKTAALTAQNLIKPIFP